MNDLDKAIKFIKDISPNDNVRFVVQQPDPNTFGELQRKRSTMAPKPPVTKLDNGIYIEHMLVDRKHILLGINREIRRKWVQELRNTWDPIKVGTPAATLSLTDPSKVEPITGNHRWLAVMEGVMTCKIEGLVVEMMFRKGDNGQPVGLTEEEKADIWFAEAVKRKQATAIDTFHNAIRRNLPAALAIDKLIRSIGRVPATTRTANAHNIACLSAVSILYRRDAATLERVFPLLGKLCEGQVFMDRLLYPLFLLERRAKTSLTTDRWAKRLLNIGYQGINNSLVTVRGHADHKSAQVILDMLNDKLRGNLLYADGLVTKEVGKRMKMDDLYATEIDAPPAPSATNGAHPPVIDPTSVPQFKPGAPVTGVAGTA